MTDRLQPIDAPERTPVCRGRIYPSWGLADVLPDGIELALPVEVHRRANGLPYVMIQLNTVESIQVELPGAEEQTLAERADAGARFAVHVVGREARDNDFPPAIDVEISELG